MIVGDKLLVLNDDGELTMALAQPGDWKVLARSKVLGGRDAWAPMALAGGRLILRDTTRMICIDLGAGPETTRVDRT